MSNYIDHIFYINLEKRTDRREEMETECRNMGLPCERIEGIPYWIGGVGCGLSHIKALKTAKQRGYKNVLIFEDDFEFLVGKDKFEDMLNKLFTDEMNFEFDICFLSYNLFEFLPMEGNFSFVKAIKIQTFSGYIVNEKMYDNLINIHSYAVDMFARTNYHWAFSIDQMWNQIVPLYNILIPVVRIGKQRAGYSDNSLKILDCAC
jgi:GR25 family glycosyltransferase involved in LPS biosynthesis